MIKLPLVALIFITITNIIKLGAVIAFCAVYAKSPRPELLPQGETSLIVACSSQRP